MKIVRRDSAGGYTLAVSGRLDSYWADHLSRTLEDALRDGADHLELDLSEVSFISSGGVRVLLAFHRRLAELGGRLLVVDPAEKVRRVLEMVGLLDVLVAGETVAVETEASGQPVASRIGVFELFELGRGAPLDCRLVGTPPGPGRGPYEARDCQAVEVPADTLGLGLGAFGEGFDDCRDRFGDFVAAGGGAAVLPTDGTGTPDFFVEAGTLVPRVQLLYGLLVRGRLSRLLRFEPDDSSDGVPLSELARVTLEVTGTDRVGLVAVAESAGLVGASLRRSPAATAPAGPALDFPEVREWLSFTPERTFFRSQVVVAGILAAEAEGPLAPWLRPLAPGGPHGHLHAAVFSPRPIPQGRVELSPTVRRLFDKETLRAILHLLHDDREVAGAGESELRRGACWVGPLAEVTAGGPGK